MIFQVHPILGTRDFDRGVSFHKDLPGFELLFSHDSNYAGFRRDNVVLHMQFQYEHEMQTTRLRFFTDDPDALFAGFATLKFFHERTRLADTPWGTRKFSFFDRDGNALPFYRNNPDE